MTKVQVYKDYNSLSASIYIHNPRRHQSPDKIQQNTATGRCHSIFNTLLLTSLVYLFAYNWLQ